MKTERRHELEKNSLADGLAKGITWGEENARLIVGIIAAVAIIGVVYAVLSNRKQERETSAWDEFFNAKAGKNTAELEKLAKSDPDLLAGQLADLALADFALNQGLDLISSDREQAEARLTEAKSYYSKLRNVSDPRLQERTALGLARVFESMGEIETATAEYKKLKDWKEGLYTDFAAQKLANLEKPATIEFAKWYRAQKPRPKPQPTGADLVDPKNLNTLPGFPGPVGTGTGAASSPASPLTPAALGTPAAPAATPTASAAPSATPSATPATTPTPTATPAATPKPSASPTASPSATPAATPVPATK